MLKNKTIIIFIVSLLFLTSCENSSITNIFSDIVFSLTVDGKTVSIGNDVEEVKRTFKDYSESEIKDTLIEINNFYQLYMNDYNLSADINSSDNKVYGISISAYKFQTSLGFNYGAKFEDIIKKYPKYSLGENDNHPSLKAITVYFKDNENVDFVLGKDYDYSITFGFANNKLKSIYFKMQREGDNL